MLRRSLFAVLTVCVLGALPCLASAPKIQWVAGNKAFSDGELEALSLDEAGVLRPGPTFTATELEAPTAWAALRHGGRVWIGTGNAGEVLTVDGEGKIQRVQLGDALMVTALAPLPEGAVAAAVAPGAVIHRVNGDGTSTTLSCIPAEYVWALQPTGRGGFVAASGVPGALWSIDAFGGVEKIVDIDDDHARCLAERDGRILVGTAPKGLVLSVHDKKVEVLRDLEAKEVVGIIARKDGELLVAANQDQAGGNVQTLANLLKQMGNIPVKNPAAKKEAKRATLQSGLVLWLENSGAVTPIWQGSKVAALSMIPDGDGAIVGTYPSGRLYRVEPNESPALLADFEEAEASVLLAGAKGLDAVVTSNPAVLQVRKDEGPKGTWTSKPIDSGAVAKWGRVTATGEGLKGLEFRSGETEEPNDSWSEWKTLTGFDGTAGSSGAVSRFLQLRATLEGEDAQLKGLAVVVAAPNRTPLIETLAEKGAGKKPSEAIPDPTAVVTITWKVEDPDGDSLAVTLEGNREGSPHWIELIDDEVVSKPQYAWDTSGLPDGIYRVRIRISDKPSNPPADAREATRTSAPMRVDNTPPRVKVSARVAGDRLLVEGEAADQPGGRIAQIRVSIDGSPWQVLDAADGILDEATEAFAASLEKPTSGAHDVVVQSRDADGNTGAGATVVTIR
jgi:hypothetical protein